MRLITTGLMLAAATALAAGALAAPTVADPMRLALQKTDVPANSYGSGPTRDSASALAPLGVRGLKGASWHYMIPAGGEVDTAAGPLPREWAVQGDVFVAPTIAGARSLFRLGKRAQVGFFSDTSGTPKSLTLPSYGDEQMAYTTTELGKVQASVFVRKGSVVWELRASSSPPKWRTTKAQAVAQLTLYATKVKRRVGRGS